MLLSQVLQGLEGILHQDSLREVSKFFIVNYHIFSSLFYSQRSELIAIKGFSLEAEEELILQILAGISGNSRTFFEFFV